MNDSQPETNKSADDREQEPLVIATRKLVYATFCVAAITFILAVATYLLYHETVKMGEITKSGIDSAYVETEKSIARADSSLRKADSSLALTKQSLDLAKQQFEIENRPYLGVKEFGFSKMEKGSAFISVAKVINYGKIPAIKVESTTNFVLHTVPDFGSFDLSKTQTLTAPNLAPSGDFFVRIYAPKEMITDDFIETIIAKEMFYFFYGKIKYSDIFNRDYSTTFCIVYSSDNPDDIIYNSTFNEVK